MVNLLRYLLHNFSNTIYKHPVIKINSLQIFVAVTLVLLPAVPSCLLY